MHATINTYLTQKSERISLLAAGLTHASEASCGSARRHYWSCLDVCMSEGGCPSPDWGWPHLGLLDQFGSFPPLIFQQASPGMLLWQWQRAKVSKLNPISTFQASAYIMFVLSHWAKEVSWLSSATVEGYQGVDAGRDEDLGYHCNQSTEIRVAISSI